MCNSLDQYSVILNRIKTKDISDSRLQRKFKKALNFSEKIVKIEKMKKLGSIKIASNEYTIKIKFTFYVKQILLRMDAGLII